MTVLKKLTYKNFFLFNHLDFEPSTGLNIITGESGAGKSLFLEGVNLLIGARLDSSLVAGLKDKAILEGIFEIGDNIAIREFLQENELDVNSELIIRREIATAGKSRCFVNDTPVSVQILKELGETLCEVHSQHKTTFIKSNSYQIDLLDNYAKTFETRIAFKETYNEVKKTQTILAELKQKQANAVKEQDFQKYLLDELIKANIADIEEEKALEDEQKILSNASEIMNLSEAIGYGVDGGEQSVESMISEIRNQFKSLSQISQTFADDFKRFESAWLELKEVAKDVGRKGGRIQVDPQRLLETEERLSLFQNLKRKHNAMSLQELIDMRDSLESNLQNFASLETEIMNYESKLQKLDYKLLQLASELSSGRKKHAGELASKVVATLKELEIPSASFEIHIESLDRNNWTVLGGDKISFLFSANAGVAMQSLENVASGGELSRLMLSFKSISDGEDYLTIFDEIDTGVSGETAMKVGSLISKMGKHTQTLVITHLPQVASKGDSHFCIHKITDKENSMSVLTKLSGEKRILEIARLLSGKTPGEKAIKNAEELLAKSN